MDGLSPHQLFFLCAVLSSIAISLVERAWLLRHTYRLAVEMHLPTRSHFWIVLTAPILVGVATLGLVGSWPSWVVVGSLLFIMAWLVAAAIDIDVGRLPNAFTLPLAGFAVIWAFIISLELGDWTALGRALLAGVAYAGAYLLLKIISRALPPHRDGIGMGDVKLALSLGVQVGWFGWTQLVFAFFLTFVVGAIWAIFLLIFHKVGTRDAFSFGPAMVVGASLAFLFAYH